ncbi:hypothetical protein HMPREF9554_01168, partial [Treponema phagedenis F0421]
MQGIAAARKPRRFMLRIKGTLRPLNPALGEYKFQNGHGHPWFHA